MKTLMLLDVYGLVYRAFFALPPLNTSQGVPIGAAYGFTQMLNRLLGEEKPTHLVACFDQGIPTQRKERFPDYKAQRSAMPEDLRPQFELVRRILETLRIPMLSVPGEEADDLIATLARQATEAGVETLVVTGDLDLLQFVDEHVTALVTRRGISELARYDPAAVRERFGLGPEQLADYRGLKGDPSDNLPGIPGIGEKTATRLLQAAGSLDHLLAHPELATTPKLRQSVIDYAEQARACRDVSIIRKDLPVELDWEACARAEPDPGELYRLYHELEFKTLLQRLPEPADRAALLSEVELEGEWRSLEEWDPAELAGVGPIGLAVLEDRLGVAWSDGRALDFPLAWLERPEVRRALSELAPWKMHDAKSGGRRLAELGVEVDPASADVMVAAHLLDASRTFVRLEDAVQQFLQRSLPAAAGAHALACLRLAPLLETRLAQESQQTLYHEVELPITDILRRMEQAGVAIDLPCLAEVGSELDRSVVELQGRIFEAAGEEFNIGSPQQLGVVLFEKLGLPGGKRNKTGWATGVEVLQGLTGEHPLPALVLDYREATKLKNTYVDVIPTLIDGDGRLRTQFNQTVTATGRLSSAHPNLQNIPVRGELGRRIRKAFVAPPGRVLLAADYDQIELRLMAHLSQDPSMRQAFALGNDIHDFTARQIFNITGSASREQRRIAKSVNFGLLYGMSDFGLASRLGIPRAEARDMIAAYFARFPSVKAYIASVLEEGRKHGYVATILGRRRWMPALRSPNAMQRHAAEREATNAPIQGSAADLMKAAMVRVDRRLRGGPARMLLQIHDELILEVPQDQLGPLAAQIGAEMRDALELSVPIEVSLKAGPNWHDLTPV